MLLLSSSRCPLRPLRTVRRRGFTLVELLVTVSILGVLAALAMTGWRRVRDEAEETKVLNATRVLYGAQQTWRSAHPSFQSDPTAAAFQQQGGYTEEPDVVILAQMATATRWAAILRRRDGGQVCGGLIDRVRSTSAVDCGTTPVFPISLSSTTPGAGEAVTLDVSTALALMLAEQRPQPSGELAAQGGQGMRQRDPILIAWDFGDGSPPVGGPVATHARLSHTFLQPAAARCPIRAAVIDAAGRVHVGEATGGAALPYGSCRLSSDAISTPGTPAPPTLPPDGDNRPPEGELRLSAETIQPGQWITASAVSAFDPDGRIVAWRWTLNGAPIPGVDTTAKSLRRQLTTPGTVAVGLTLVDNRGATTQLTGTVQVGAARTGFQANIQLDVEGQSREIISSRRAVTLIGTATGAPDGAPLSYRWEVGSSETFMGSTIQKRFAFPGLYRLRLVVTGPNGTQAVDERTISVVANNPPTAIGQATPLADSTGSPITLSDGGSSDSDGPLSGLTHRWVLPDGTERRGAPVTVTFARPGPQIIRHQVLDDLGDVDEDTVLVTAINRAPRGGSVSCAESELDSGSPVSCSVSGAWVDPDGGTLAYAWDLGAGWVGSGGNNTSVSGAWRTPGPRTVRLTVTDGQGGSSPVTTTVTVRNRPPTGGQLVCEVPGQAPPILSQSVVQCRAIGWLDPDGDIEQSGGTAATLSYTMNYATLGTQAGQITTFIPPRAGLYPVTLTVQDTDGGTATATATVPVINRPPNVPIITCDPLDAPTGTLLTCGISPLSLADPDGVIASIQWSTDGLVAVTGQQGATTGTTATYRRQAPGPVSVTARSVDDEGAFSLISTPVTLTFTNRAPTDPTLSCAPDLAEVGEQIRCVATGSTDPDSGSVSYGWSSAGRVETSGDTAWFALTAPAQLQVQARALDGQGGTSNWVSRTVGFRNRPPTAPLVTCVPLSSPTGTALTCSASGSTDPDGAGAILYHWSTEGRTSGSTGPSATYRRLSPGTLSVTAQAEDNQVALPGGSRFGQASTPVVVTFTNRAPSAPTITCSPTSIVTGSEIACSIATPAVDPDSGVVTYTWSALGRQSSATGTSATYSQTTPGPLTVRVTAADGQGGTSAEATTEITFLNRAPSTPTLVCSPLTTPTGSPVSCVASGSVDPDGGVVTYVWSWEGFESAAGANNSQGTFRRNTPGPLLITVQAQDNQGGISAVSSSVTVSLTNRAPSAPTAIVCSPTSPVAGSETRCVASGGTDPDGGTIAYQWQVSNGQLVGTSGDTARVLRTAPGAATIDARSSDTQTTAPNGALVSGWTSETVTFTNRPPSAPSVSCVPTSTPTGSLSTCTATGSVDPDGGAIVYRWSVTGRVAVAGADSSTATYTVAAPGAVSVTATAVDPFPELSVASAAVSLSFTNRAPDAPSVSCVPASAPTGTQVTCSATSSSDPDGGSVTYEWRASPSGAILQGPQNRDLVFTVNTPSTVTPEARARDGQTGIPGGEGLSAWTARSVVITNRAPSFTGVPEVRAGTETGGIAIDTLRVREAPNGTLISTMTGRGITVPTTDAVQVSVTAADPDGGTLAWTTELLSPTGEVASTSSSMPTTVTPTSPGLWSARVSVTDGQGAPLRTIVLPITASNRPPSTPAITCSPISTPTGTTATCSVTGPSVDLDGGTVTYAWSSNGRTGAATGTSTTYSLTTPGTVTAVVTASDGQGGSSANAGTTLSFTNRSPVFTSLTLTASGPSTLTNEDLWITEAPAWNGISMFAGQRITVATGTAVTGVVAASDPDGGTVTWSYVARRLPDGADVASSTTGSLTFTPPTPGEWLLVPHITDGQGAQSRALIIPVTATNRAPTVPTVTCSATTVSTGQSVTCSASGSTDPDGGTVAYNWSPGGRTGNATGPSTTYTLTTPGTVVVTAVATDGQGGNSPDGAISLTFTNRPPTAPTISCTPLSAESNTPVSCSVSTVSTDPDGGTVTYTWSPTHRTGSATGTTTTYQANLIGTYTVSVTAADGQGATTPSAATTITMLNRPPVIGANYTVTWVSGDPQIGTATRTSPVRTVRYDGSGPRPQVGTSTGAEITVASGSTADVTVTALDPEGQPLTWYWCTTSPSGSCWDDPRVRSNVPSGQSVTERFTFSRPGVWTFAPHAWDGATDGLVTYIENIQVTVHNRAPSTPTLSCAPTSAPTGSTITCSASGATDPDGGTITYEWNWTGGFTPPSVSGPGNTTATFTHVTPGAGIIYVRAKDGQSAAPNGEGVSAWAQQTHTAMNRAPTHGTTSCAPMSAPTGTPITCTTSWSDPDGGSLEYFMGFWNSAGSVYFSGATWSSTPTRSFTPTTPGEYGVWVGVRDNQGFDCSATWNAPGDGSCWMRYVLFTITNRPPTAPTVSCTPTGIQPTSTTVTCTASGSTDADGGTITYTWSNTGRTGAATGATTTYTLATAGTDANNQLSNLGVTATASDGQGGNTASSAATLIFLNRPPTDGTVSASPSWTVSTNDAVTFTFSGYSDPDGSVTSYAAYMSRYPGNTPSRGEGLSTSATFAYGCCGELAGGDNVYRVVWGSLPGVNQPATVTATYSRPGTYTVGGGAFDNIGAPSWRDRGYINNFQTLTVNNRRPSNPTVTCTPGSTPSGQSIVCTASGGTDPDGGTVAYEWTNTAGPSVVISGPANNTATFTSAVPTTINVWARATDGQSWAPNGAQASDWVMRGDITWSNRVPTMSASGCTANTLFVGQTTTCQTTWSDPDGGTLQYFQGFWNIAGSVNYVGATWRSSNQLSFTPTEPGTYGFWASARDQQGFDCSATWNGGSGTCWQSYQTITVPNRDPGSPTISCSPTSVVAGGLINCTTTTSGDPDGQQVDLAINYFNSSWAYLTGGTSGYRSGTSSSSYTIGFSPPSQGTYFAVAYVRDSWAGTWVQGGSTSLTASNRNGSLTSNTCPNGVVVSGAVPFSCSVTVSADPDGQLQRVVLDLYRAEWCYDEQNAEWYQCLYTVTQAIGAWSSGAATGTVSTGALSAYHSWEEPGSGEFRVIARVQDQGDWIMQALAGGDRTFSTRLTPLNGSISCVNETSGFTCSLVNWQGGVTNGVWQLYDEYWNYVDLRYGTSVTFPGWVSPGTYTVQAAPSNTWGSGPWTSISHTYVPAPPPPPQPGSTSCSGETNGITCWINWLNSPTGLQIRAIDQSTGQTYEMTYWGSPWGSQIWGLPGDRLYTVSVRAQNAGGASSWVGYPWPVYVQEQFWGYCDYGNGPELCY